MRGFSIIVAAAVLVAFAPSRADAACIAIQTVADLNNIRANPAASYCLSNDLDLSAIAKFVPIGNSEQAFTGIFDGRNHVIRNLSIRSAGAFVGLFGWLDSGTVRNLTLAGVSIKSTGANAQTGAVAGMASGIALISNVHVSGAVRCTGDGCRVGGLVGEAGSEAVMRNSSVVAWVTSGNGGAAGGMAGQTAGKILKSYTTGQVACGANCSAGGLAGHISSTGVVMNSFAAGPVIGAIDGSAGGIAGTQHGLVRHSYSTGSIRGRTDGLIASLIGYHGGIIGQAYAVGRVTAGAGSSTGGLVAALAPPNPKTNLGFWDATVTRQGSSAQGVSKTTAQLQAELPARFDGSWGITKGYSYPFLADAEMDFASALATTVKALKVYTFVPLKQREPTEYLTVPVNTGVTSLAAVYTMIGRGIGITVNNGALKRAPIDRYFWDHATKSSIWTGPVTDFASLGSVKGLGAGAIGDGNIIGPLKARNVVILRGHYDRAGGGTVAHWMLATLFTSDNGGVTTSLIANDPWTGRQVWIDPVTRRVTRPADFPLTSFRVDGYRVVTLN